MKLRSALLLCASSSLFLGLVFASACQTATLPSPRFQVDPQRYSAGIPAPADTTGAAPEHAAAAALTIRPETSVGYDQLPTTVTQLFDASPVALSLGDVVNMTLANERGIAIKGYDLRIAQYEVPVSKGIYDLMLSAGATFNRIEEQNSGSIFGQTPVNSQRIRQGTFSISQLVPSGGILTLGYNVVRMTNLITAFDQNFNPALATNKDYQQKASIGFSQPLLRGFGSTVTNAGIRIAEIEQEGASADFQTNLEDTLNQVMQTYWDLVGSIELYKVREISYSAAQDLLRVNTAKLNAGAVPQTDVLQAKAAAESRRAEVIRARQNVRDIEDDLKRRIFLQAGTPNWNAEIQPAQAIEWREIQVDQDQAIAMALADRSEVARAQSNIDQNKVKLAVAQNAKLPSLNLVGDVEANGLDTSFDKSLDTTTDGKYASYDIGLQLSYPLQNRTARYKYKQAEARNAQSEETLRQLQDQITLEVRQSIRALRTARERIDAEHSAVASQEEKLRSERKRYDVGISTAFEVLTFQDDLATAQSQYIGAVVDYNKAALQLDRARGTLLKTFGVQIIDADPLTKSPSGIFPVGAN